MQPTSAQSGVAEQRLQVENALKGPASWFVVIAGLSLVNSVLSMTGAGVRFIFGLGITESVDRMAHQVGSTGVVLDLIINGVIAGVFVLIWKFAKKGEIWAWYGGVGLYVLDGLLLLMSMDFLSVAFHAWALYRMSPGLKLLPVLKQLNQKTATGAVSSTF